MTERVSALDVEVYRVPTDQPEADGTATWSSTTVVVVRVRVGDISGLGWTYGAAAAAALIRDEYAEHVCGADALAPPRVTEGLIRASRNLGRPGVAATAISAVDIALWDLKARLLDLPLCSLLGQVRDEVPVYGSGGFTTYDDATTRGQLESWVQGLGIPRVKIKIGESWGSDVARDVHRVALARDTVGADVELFVDANGGYSTGQAVRVGRLLDELGVSWFEEPVSSDDLAGLALVRAHVTADVAAGEYGYSVGYFGRMCAAGAVDCLQADATRCGGVTGWLQAAAVAAGHHLQISGHCAPNLHAHPASGVANLRHLEWFHDHVRIEQMLFDGALTPAGGSLQPDLSRPGHGLTLRSADAAAYRIG